MPSREVRDQHVLVPPRGGLDARVTIEAKNPAPEPKLVARRIHHNARARVFRAGHLAGHKLAPDEVVEPLGVAFHGQGRGLYAHVRRANGFVGLLGLFPTAVEIGLLREVGLPVLALDEAPGGADGIPRQVRRVGPHVGDVACLVEALGQGHGFLHAKAEPGGRGLLQRRGDEGGSGARGGRLVLSAAHHEVGFPKGRQGLLRLRLRARPESPFRATVHLEASRGALPFRQQVRKHLPIFLGHEGADFPLPLHDEAHRYGLHSAGGQPPGHLGPEQGRDHVAHHPIEEAPSLLRMDPIDVDLPRFRKGRLDGALRNLVEDHALIAFWTPPEGLLKMPSDGFPFPVKVRGQINRIHLLRRLSKIAHDLLFSRQHLVVGGPTVVRVHPHARHELGLRLGFFMSRLGFRGQLAGFRGFRRPSLRIDLRSGAAHGKIADMPNARLHDEVVAEVTIDGLRLCRRFDDHKGFGHGVSDLRRSRRRRDGAARLADPRLLFQQ